MVLFESVAAAVATSLLGWSNLTFGLALLLSQLIAVPVIILSFNRGFHIIHLHILGSVVMICGMITICLTTMFAENDDGPDNNLTSGPVSTFFLAVLFVVYTVGYPLAYTSAVCMTGARAQDPEMTRAAACRLHTGFYCEESLAALLLPLLLLFFGIKSDSAVSSLIESFLLPVATLGMFLQCAYCMFDTFNLW